MCGICGIYGESNSKVINKMLQVIKHRGPDAYETVITGEHCFGAARLALVSGQNGRQPARVSCNSMIVLFNGEIYNYQELKTSLVHPLAEDASEVELIGALYNQHGLEAFSMLRGMFAIAIFDTDRLILARDGFGIKPLFYSQIGNKLIFCFGAEVPIAASRNKYRNKRDGLGGDGRIRIYLYPGTYTI
jgi:asparagine synthase (glutamine-hydrolysing)